MLVFNLSIIIALNPPYKAKCTSSVLKIYLKNIFYHYLVAAGKFELYDIYHPFRNLAFPGSVTAVLSLDFNTFLCCDI